MTHKFLLFIVASVLSFTLFQACKDKDLYPIPTPEYAPVAVFKFNPDKPQNSYFNATDLSNAVFSFILDQDAFDDAKAAVDKIDVNIIYTSGGIQIPKAIPDDSVLLKPAGLPYLSYNSFPVNIDITAQDAASKFGKAATDLKLGDKFTLVFIVYTKDGRRFTYYANNICNSPRVIGTCSYDILVINPGAVVATLGTSKNGYSKASIATAEYAFTVKAKNYNPSVTLDSVRVDIDYQDSTTTIKKPFTRLTSLTTFPATVSIKAVDAAKLFGLAVTDLKISDRFRIKFTHFTSDGKSFTNFGGGACGVNFPTNEQHPFNDPKTDVYNPTPPNTLAAGTCNLTWSITK